MRVRILCGRVTAPASRQEIAMATISRTGPRAMQSFWKSERVLKATRRSIQTSTSKPFLDRVTHTATGRRIRRRGGVANRRLEKDLRPHVAFAGLVLSA